MSYRFAFNYIIVHLDSPETICASLVRKTNTVVRRYVKGIAAPILYHFIHSLVLSDSVIFNNFFSFTFYSYDTHFNKTDQATIFVLQILAQIKTNI